VKHSITYSPWNIRVKTSGHKSYLVTATKNP
jgi:hypothetical protein